MCMAISRQRTSRERMAMTSIFRDVERAFAWFLYSTEYFLTTFFDTLHKACISVATAGCTTAGEITSSYYARVVFITGCDYFPFFFVLIKNPEGFGLFRAQQMGNSLFGDCCDRERGWGLELNALLINEEYACPVGLQALNTVTSVSGVGSLHQNFSTFNGLASQWTTSVCRGALPSQAVCRFDGNAYD